ncbi:hypothetical protein VTN31DRAFT_3517 [Thermomyces dupontii]|uniref:uncharacterized protein n=1 Tax=Talaromyces thermophilus TaxID=28565 RepID=UPI003742828C
MKSTQDPVSVLFVCLGNICRSPMAEAVFKRVSESHPNVRIGQLDSAGTGAYHSNEPPDERTMSTLRSHGITDYNHAARQIEKEDFHKFDYIVAMDKPVLRSLLRLRDSVGATDSSKIADVRLFGDFNLDGTVNPRVGGGEEVPDPYYGGIKGFEKVYEQVMRFSEGLLAHIEKKRNPDG